MQPAAKKIIVHDLDVKNKIITVAPVKCGELKKKEM